MLAGRIIWIDANDNAAFDPGETSKVTDSAGGFSFTVTAGAYTVRQLLPDDWYQAADLIFAYQDYDWGEYSGGGRYLVWLQDEDGNDVGPPESGDLSDFGPP